MNSLSIFLYVVSIIMWWAGFNYAATRTESPTRRKLLSTAAAFALAWPAAFIALAGALATKAAANLMIAVGNGINNTWDAAVNDEGDTTIVTKLTPMGTAMRVRHENSDTDTETVTETHPALADYSCRPHHRQQWTRTTVTTSTERTPAATKRLRRPPTTQT